jgi:signal peptidase I
MRRGFSVLMAGLQLLILAACTPVTPVPSPTPEATSTPALRAYWVQQVSMLPTLHEGQMLLIEEVPVAQLPRGDILVVQPPGRQAVPILKRLIGLPGETVEIRKDKVYINGKELDEPYIKIPGGRDYAQATLGSDEYFVLGDNRPNSSDSRHFGPISGASILGRVMQ